MEASRRQYFEDFYARQEANAKTVPTADLLIREGFALTRRGARRLLDTGRARVCGLDGWTTAETVRISGWGSLEVDGQQRRVYVRE